LGSSACIAREWESRLAARRPIEKILHHFLRQRRHTGNYPRDILAPVSQTPPAARTESAPPPRARVPELDGLRGIAILLVLVFHFRPTAGPLRFLNSTFATGWIGVDLFFVLSGYLITGILLDSVGRPHYYRNFIARRSLRIFPLYYGCLLLYGVLRYLPNAIQWKDYLVTCDAWWYVGYLGNLQMFLQNRWPGAPMLTPLWSLQVEEQFYLTFPLLVWAVKRSTLARVLAGCVIAAPLLRIGLALAMPANAMGPYALTPCRMDALAMGGLVAVAARKSPGWLKGRWIGWMTALAAAAFLLVCIFTSDTPWSTPWSIPMRTVGYSALDIALTGVLVMLVGWRQPHLLKACRVKFLMWLGTISYGLYMLHIPALDISRRWVVPLLRIEPSGSAEFFVKLVLAIAMAWISWTIFEAPILRLKGRFTTR